jgi:hypothetical protein
MQVDHWSTTWLSHHAERALHHGHLLSWLKHEGLLV